MFPSILLCYAYVFCTVKISLYRIILVYAFVLVPFFFLGASLQLAIDLLIHSGQCKSLLFVIFDISPMIHPSFSPLFLTQTWENWK